MRRFPKIVFWVTGFLLFGYLSLSEAFRIPDTGQSKCYQGVSPWAEIACAGTGQDGEYSINPMSFDNINNEIVTDYNTGLMWLRQDDGNTYNWYQAAGVYDASHNPTSQDVCGSLNFFYGWSDWRLPTKNELMTIVNYRIADPGPTIDSVYFPNAHASYYWSLSPADPAWSVDDWAVNFHDGSIYRYLKTNYYYVRCVREGQLPFGDYQIDFINGTVTDKGTGLVWQKNDTIYMTWQDALTYCNGLSLGGASDWRLPNVKELESIYSYFPGTLAAPYWTSTTSTNGGNYAWAVQSLGALGWPTDKYDVSYVRCVRGGYSWVELVNLSISRLGIGSGTVASSPSGINCGDICSAFFPADGTVVLSATPDVGGSIFSGWYLGDLDCSDGAVTMNWDMSCNANFDFCPGTTRARIGSADYDSIYLAYTNATASGDTIEVIASNQEETPYFDQGKVVTLKGGYDCQFELLPYSYTTISGSLTIDSGTVTVDRIVIL